MHHIFERIVSILIFSIVMLFFVLRIRNTNDYRKIKRYLIAYSITLAIMAFLFTPFGPLDLTRLQSRLDNYYRYLSFEMFISMLTKSSTFTTTTYFYVISKIGINDLLQSFSTLAFYLIVFYTIYDYGKSKKVDSKIIAQCVLFIILNGQFIELVSNIRTTVGFSIIYLCLYREFFQKKSFISDLFLYLIALGIHSALLPLLIIRVLFLLVQKEKNTISKIINFILFLMILVFFARYGLYFIDKLIQKADIYLSVEADNYVQYGEYVTATIRILLVLFILAIQKKSQENKNKDLKNYIKLILIYVLLDVGFCYNYSIFHRYSIYISLLILPLLLSIKIKKETSYITNYRIYSLIYNVLLYSIAAISFTVGDMNNLAFFLLY